MSVAPSSAQRPTPAARPPAPTAESRRIRELITPEGIDLRLEIADASARAGAFVIDLLILIVGAIIFALILIAAMSAAHKSASDAVQIVGMLGFFLARNFYFVIFELTPAAATPGKRALGLRVAARNGGRLDASAIFARNAMRELEFFLPMIFLIVPAAGWTDGLLKLLGIIWTGVFLLFPLFNRDRLRVGDLVAGTWVVRAPRRRLDVDLADASQGLGAYVFSAAQVQAYGIKELHVLEEVLRRKDRRTMTAVAERIRGKISWLTIPDENDLSFLNAYYAALRGRLESRLLFGHRRKDKFDTA